MPNFQFRSTAYTASGSPIEYSGNVEAATAEQGANQVAEHTHTKGIGQTENVYIDDTCYRPKKTGRH